MGKYGRPKLPAAERRDAATLNVRLNQSELEIVKEKAARAGVTAHEWVRLAALEQNPPARPVVPEINHEIWLETGKILAALRSAIHGFRPGLEGPLRAALEGTKDQLAGVRKLLLGGDKS